MADNLPTLTVAPTRKPSFLNSGAAIGLVTGGLLATTIPFAAPIGLVAGAWLGKRKMQKEEQFGKQVSPPSRWNLGTFFGSAVGLSVGASVAATTLAIVGASTGGVGLLALAGFAACTAIGGAIGSKIGKHFQKRHYKAAELQVMQEGEFVPSPAQERAQEQEIQAPAKSKGKGKSAAEALAQAGQQLDPQQLAQLQALAAQGKAMTPAQPESMQDKVAQSRLHAQEQQR